MTTFKTNVTLQELEDLVKFAKEHGEGTHKTVTIMFAETELASCVFVAKNYDSPIRTDVTNYDAW